MWSNLATVLFVICLVLICSTYWMYDSMQKTEQTKEGLIAIINDKSTSIQGLNHERYVIEDKIMVDRQTFDNLIEEKVKGWEKSSGFKLGKINSLVEATYYTIRKGRAIGRDTIMVFSSDTSVHKKDTVVVFNFSNQWGSEKIIVKDKEAIRIDSSRNKIAIIESRDKWKLKNLWRKRKKKVSLLIFTPNSQVDTLQNLEVLER
jgi:hypothetical protein